MDNTIVEEHRKMLVLSWELSDFQLKNLKTWPFLLFDNIDKVEISYDFTKTIQENDEEVEDLCAGKIEFNIIFNKNTKIKKEVKEKGLETLSLWTKFLFWNDTEVIIKRNGKIWT